MTKRYTLAHNLTLMLVLFSLSGCVCSPGYDTRLTFRGEGRHGILVGEEDSVHHVDNYDLTWLIRGNRDNFYIVDAEVSDPDIFSVRVITGDVVVKALKPGKTTLSAHLVRDLPYEEDAKPTKYLFTKTVELHAIE